MTIKYATAPAENGSGDTDLFEQTWDRYLDALEEMRKIRQEQRDNVKTLETSNAARDSD